MTGNPDQITTIGVVAGGESGAAFVRNLTHHGYRLAVYEGSVNATASTGEDQSVVPVASAAELAAAVRSPRLILSLDATGRVLDSLLDTLLPGLDPGDVIADGAPADFQDTGRRSASLRAAGVHFAGVGVTGGPLLIEEGPSFVVGSDSVAFGRLRPVLTATAARFENMPCVAHVGLGSAGHFALLVYDGLIAAEVGVLSEAYTLLRSGLGFTAAQIARIFRTWEAEEPSTLLGTAIHVLERADEDPRSSFTEKLAQSLPPSGTGARGLHVAVDFGLPVTVAAAALDARTLRRHRWARPDSTPPLLVSAGHIHDAWQAARIAAYAQQFTELRTVGTAFGWGMDLAGVASSWRAGSALAGRFLSYVREACLAAPDGDLLTDLYFAEKLRGYLPSWQRVVAAAAAGGIALPVLAAGLQYVVGQGAGDTAS